MKKNLTIIGITILIIISSMFAFNNVYATETETDNEPESELIKLREKELKTLEDYEETYGSKSYGLTAYILHKVQIYSIPLCFLGILIGAILDYVIGVRHLENKEKGLALMIGFVTIAIICQVLPLVFAIVVKFGRE